MKTSLRCLIVMVSMLITSHVFAQTFTVNSDQSIAGTTTNEQPGIAGTVSGSVITNFATGTYPNWTFTFSQNVVNWNGYTLTYGRTNNTDRGLITFNMNGGAISNVVGGVVTNGLSLETLPQKQGTTPASYTYKHIRSDSVSITNVSAISMGGIDTAAAITPDDSNYPVGGDITIGTSGDPVSGNIRIDYLYSYGGSYGDGSSYGGGGDVTIHGEGNVIIADGDGVAGDIMAWSSRSGAGEINIQHQGQFLAGALDTSIFGGSTSARAGNMTFDGGNSSSDFTAAYIKANYHGGNYSSGTPEIQISNYNSITITGVVESILFDSAQGNRYAGNVTINTGISGDITIGDVIDLTTFDAGGNNGTLKLACTGAVTLAELDLNKVLYASLDSGGLKSTIMDAISNFDVTESATSGSGTRDDPKIPENETRLRAPAGQMVYYEYENGVLNDTLGGYVWQLPNPDNSGDGGKLMPVPAVGTVVVIQ